ncbi:MAG: CDP-2,3-bis-(O-geranylgeranyl)-sn-glycerol synthase [Candidatus Thorarchaeota archaeon]
MYEELALVGLALWLGLPAWIANSTPVLLGGGAPIDGGRNFRDGRRILGDGKTIRGFVAGVVCGTLVGILQILVAPILKVEMAKYLLLTPEMDEILYFSSFQLGLSISITVVVLLSVGTLTGDMLGSFLKRRFSVKSGGPSPILDQLGFVIMALIFASPFLHPNPLYPMILIILTLGIHWLSNALGYLLGFKKNPW